MGKEKEIIDQGFIREGVIDSHYNIYKKNNGNEIAFYDPLNQRIIKFDIRDN